MKVHEYAEELKKWDIDPWKTYEVKLEISELELNALEDLLFTELSEEEREVVEHICKCLFMKIIKSIGEG